MFLYPRTLALDAHTCIQYTAALLESSRETCVIDATDKTKLQLTPNIFENCDIWLKVDTLFYPVVIYFEEERLYVVDYHLVKIIDQKN